MLECAKHFWRRYSNDFAKRTPSAIEEIEGIAEGSKLPLEVAFFASTRDLLPQGDGCTAVVCGASRSASGMPLIGQTKDTAAPLDRYKLMVLHYASGLRAVTLGYAGWVGNMSLNIHGLAWTGNSLYAPEPTGRMHPGSLLKRIFLESATVAEVLERSEGMRVGNACFCLADRTGRGICMEWVDGERDLIEVGDRLYGHANDILGRFRNKDRSHRELPGSTQRQKRISELLLATTTKISPEDFEKWFRDHQHSPHSICSHPSGPGTQSTTAAYVADLSRLEFRVVIGPPCQQKFTIIPFEEL